jgi:uncharacterized YigZ family protein
MESIKDTYKTISEASKEVLFKDRGSKFYGYAFPVETEEQIKAHIEQLKKNHHAARHWCYAWQLGKGYERYRVNDDGEPTNSAGLPIYGQLQSFELTNTLVVVVRYFGGTKLGVGGLIQAYKTAAKEAITASKIVEKTIDISYKLKFEYEEMNKVMRIIKEENLTIEDQKFEMTCLIYFSIRQKEAKRIFLLFENTFKVDIKKI